MIKKKLHGGVLLRMGMVDRTHIQLPVWDPPTQVFFLFFVSIHFCDRTTSGDECVVHHKKPEAQLVLRRLKY